MSRTWSCLLDDPYFQNVRNALIRSGHTPADAYRITWGAIRRWARGGGKAHPEVVAAAQAALADLAAKSAIAHSHANEGGAAVSLSWNGQHIDLASVELGSYIAPHLPAGTPQGGQFGTTSGGGASAGKTAGSAKAAAQARASGLAKRAALHAQANALRAQAKTLQAQITALNATIALQVKATAAAAPKPKASATAKAAAAIKKAATKAAPAKTPAKPKKPTLAANRASVASLKTQVSSLLSRAAALDRQAAAVKLANGGGMDFLELAVADALAVPDPALRRQVLPPADRVPPGVREGGQYAPKAGVLTSHDTPEQAAAVINGMGPRQRAAVRASTLPPPGFEWHANDRLAPAG